MPGNKWPQSGLALLLLAATASAQSPTNNPVAHYELPWTDRIRWHNVVAIEPADEPATLAARLDAAQERLAQQGGGVVYFPPGDYEFTDHVLVRSGIVIRGATPEVSSAKNEKYAPPTRFRFPKYQPTFTGHGTPNDTAFKGVRLADPVGGGQCGLVNVDLRHGHVEFGTADVLKSNVTGRGVIVFGCVVYAAAVPDPSIPRVFQPPWQRWVNRHHGAIHVNRSADVLVANNRIPPSRNEAFTMPGYRLLRFKHEPADPDHITDADLETQDVVFDYDNRAGISVNAVAVGPGLSVWNRYLDKPPQPDPPPHALGTGLVIRDNDIFNTGCLGIIVTGDGAVVAQNRIRFAPNIVRPTSRGAQADHFTNDNRAIEVRGHRWTVAGNDYEVHQNIHSRGGFYNDGEGIMHEAWLNGGVKDSRLLDNVGNRYLCFWRVPIDGLEIRGNRVPMIRLFGRTNPPSGNVLLPCHNVQIISNITTETGILVQGITSNVIVRGNQQRPGKLLIDVAGHPITVEDNEGYRELREPQLY